MGVLLLYMVQSPTRKNSHSIETGQTKQAAFALYGLTHRAFMERTTLEQRERLTEVALIEIDCRVDESPTSASIVGSDNSLDKDVVFIVVNGVTSDMITNSVDEVHHVTGAIHKRCPEGIVSVGLRQVVPDGVS